MMNKAVFLDRDGVINDGTLYYTYKVNDFTFNQGVFEGLKRLQDSGFKLIVITNQGGVAKGEYTIDDIELVHQFMKTELQERGIILDAIYYCPHHSDISQCECRKPGTLMIEQAIQKFNIDTSKSYLIGDSERDIIAAKKMGLTPIKTSKNENIELWCIKIAEGII
jgi:D-glycero-D-manno-heptose 1,7-bisphosphate phosphatase